MQDVVALGAKLVVVRGQPHLLSVRLELGVEEDSSQRRVAALVRKSDPQTEALSQRLLAPLVNWRARPAKAAVIDPAAPEIAINPIVTKAANPTH